MTRQAIDGTSQPEAAGPSGGPFPLERAYARIMTALSRTGILTPLPRSRVLGVIGIDGKEYPGPTLEQTRQVFLRNEELVDRKSRQGFTQLQLTPMAMPTSELIDRARTALLEHAAAGTIFQTKRDPADADVPVGVNIRDPIWVWDRVRPALYSGDLVYFPRVYTPHDHRGSTKEEVMRNPRLCALPGWSVGLIEPMPFTPRLGQGQMIGGRKQLEEYATPRDYLRTLSTPPYEGETGWTPEDFLTHFVTQLETIHQVSHDRHDGNILWLLGAYLPDAVPYAELVPAFYWDSDAGRRLRLSTHRTGNRFRGCAARSVVRLGG